MITDRIKTMLQACEAGQPPFPPTVLFNEIWLLRIVIDWFAGLGSELVVEFPDPDDVQVRRLLARKREGSHPDYTRSDFEQNLRARFEIVSSVELASGTRALYHATPRP